MIDLTNGVKLENVMTLKLIAGLTKIYHYKLSKAFSYISYKNGIRPLNKTTRCFYSQQSISETNV